MIQYPQNGWYSHLSFLKLVTAIRLTAAKHVAWLDFPNTKYIEVRIDMRSGDFIVKNQYGIVIENETLLKLLNLNKE